MDNRTALLNYSNSPYAYLLGIISSSQTHDSDDVVLDTSSRNDLDPNANTAVVSHKCIIVADTGKQCQVLPFTLEYEAPQEVLDAVILHESATNGDTHLLLLRNATSVPNMANNLIPPFLLREVGIEIYDVPTGKVIEPLYVITQHTFLGLLLVYC